MRGHQVWEAYLRPGDRFFSGLFSKVVKGVALFSLSVVDVNERSDKPMHLHTEDDLSYIENYSFFLDILILIKPIGVDLKGEGAF